MMTRIVPLLLAAILLPVAAANVSAQQAGSTPQTPPRPEEKIDEFKDVGYQFLRERRETLQRDIPRVQSEVESLGLLLRRYSQLDEDMASAKAALEGARSDPATSRDERRRLEDRVRYLESDQKRRAREEPQASNDLAQKQAELKAMRQEIDRVEREINRRIDIETPRQDFKKYMSLSFAALVGVVIVGFFLIAARDETVRRDVFSGQAGLQFITLFSLIIAIILFGIVGILEGKELSALLGGLSGYILGRSSGQKADDTPAPAGG